MLGGPRLLGFSRSSDQMLVKNCLDWRGGVSGYEGLRGVYENIDLRSRNSGTHCRLLATTLRIYSDYSRESTIITYGGLQD